MNVLELRTLATQSNTSDDGAGTVGILIALAIVAVTIAACWRMYQKAKRPGWAAIIPIYNIYVLLKIVGRPGWWLLLYLVPLVNLIVHIVVSIDTAKVFRKGAVFGLLALWLFPIVGYVVLGFGAAKYKGVPKR